MNRILFFILFIGLYLAAEVYTFQALRLNLDQVSVTWRRIILITYWVLSGFLLAGVVMSIGLDMKAWRTFFMSAFFILFMGKLVTALFLMVDDLRRGVTWLVNLFPQVEPEYDTSRAKFMTQAGLVAGAIPVATLSFGILSGAHDYRVRQRTISFPNLPKSFDGIRIAQLSDIHTGSFFNKTAVQGGVDLLNAEKPDLAVFTGDLVNDQSSEAKPYLDIFKDVKADLGTFSVMGNHDYGDYRSWASEKAKRLDVKQLHDMHAYMGWDLLLNDSRSIQVNGESFGLLGVENWGKGRFAKYGDLEGTQARVKEQPFKLLLSHDPSHWDAQVRPDHADIDLTLSGHTHGFQFGIEIGNWRWSPSQYIYKQWADLYQEGNQYLYVNRGFGYIGYPGRVGILPEITILELKRG